MGWLRRTFKRRPDRFIELLLQQAEYTVQGTEALSEYLEHPSEERADEVTRIEREALSKHFEGPVKISVVVEPVGLFVVFL